MGLIKKIFRKMKYKLLINRSYKQMEQEGIAIFNMCSGINGNCKCTDCPYYTNIEDYKMKKSKERYLWRNI